VILCFPLIREAEGKVPAAVAITRGDYTAAELRQIAARTHEGDAARRTLALAHVMDGRSRGEGAALCGMDRQILRDWVHRYNGEGFGRAFDRVHCGRPPRLSAEQQAEVARWIRQGPWLSEDGVVRRRLVDLAGKIKRQFGVRLAERSVGSLAASAWLPPTVGATASSAQGHCGAGGVQKNFADLVVGCVPPHARGKPIEIWWQDDARVGQQGTLTRVLAERGSRPPAPRDQRYDWAYLFGAVCPARGTGAGLVLPEANTEAMNLHLAEIERHIMPDSHAVVVLDRAGWHQLGGRLNVLRDKRIEGALKRGCDRAQCG
jgi:transposase